MAVQIDTYLVTNRIFNKYFKKSAKLYSDFIQYKI